MAFPNYINQRFSLCWVRLETNLQSQLLPFRSLVASAIGLECAEHVVDLNYCERDLLAPRLSKNAVRFLKLTGQLSNARAGLREFV